MIIKNINGYLDGGTLVITTDEDIYYVDNRIRTKTPGVIYTSYPSKGEVALNQIELRNKLIEAIEKYDGLKQLHFEWKPKVIELLNKNII